MSDLAKDLHIVNVLRDDKFWEIPINWFEKVNGCFVEYVVIVNNFVDPFCHIKGNKSQVIKVISKSEAVKYFSSINADVVIFHPLTWDYYQYVLSIPEDIIVIWSSWGYDIYSSSKYFDAICKLDLYEPYTSLELKKYYDISILCYIKQKTYKFISYISKGKFYASWYNLRSLQKKVISRINYISTVFDIEYLLIKKNRDFNASYFPFVYSWGYNYMDVSFVNDSANMIQIGNSSDPCNNYSDVLNIVAKRGINNLLYIPLAYGEEWYKNQVISNVDKLNLNAKIQTEYIDKSEYWNIIHKCRVGVFGHIRQQASDNITRCILNGCKCFFFKRSVLFQYYKSKGFYVYTIDDDLTQENVNELLTEEQRKHNVDILLKIENPDRIIKDLQNAIDNIRNHFSKFN